MSYPGLSISDASVLLQELSSHAKSVGNVQISLLGPSLSADKTWTKKTSSKSTKAIIRYRFEFV